MTSPSGGFGRRTWIALTAAGGALLVYLAITSRGGVPDPTVTSHLSHGAVIWDSGILVLREGLEAILVLAAITASFVGSSQRYRRPVAGGAAVGFAATVLTWFLAAWALGAISAPALDVQAATGLLAIAVLLVVMNWFFHRLYWTGWIAHHHRRRRDLLAGGRGFPLTFGLLALGFTAIYREGFEVILFLQNLRLKYGSAVVLDGVAIGVALTAAAGMVTFVAHHKLPYKRMLILTGALIGFVLVVMVGESAQELQLAGWLPTTTLGIAFPGWVGTWLALFPTVETLVAQGLAAAAVIGSYLVAERMRATRVARAQSSPSDRPRMSEPVVGRRMNEPAVSSR